MPLGVVNLDPRGRVSTIYNGDYQTLLHTKYRSPWPCSFREEDFLVFSIVSLWELSVAVEATILRVLNVFKKTNMSSKNFQILL